MTLTVVPDQREPLGGFAYLRFPAETLDDTTTDVRIRDEFSGRWLRKPDPNDSRTAVEEGVWGAEPYPFGPYLVERKGGFDWVRIGPEIVNQLAEFMSLEIVVGTARAAVTWPDDVIPRAAAALQGGLLHALPADNEERPQEEQVATEDAISDAIGEDEKPKRSLFLLWIVIAGLIALAAYWYFSQSPAQLDVDPDLGEGTAYDPDTATPVIEDPCSLNALTIAGKSFADAHMELKTCGNQISPEVALNVIEDAVANDDPAALTLMGKLYDDGQSADVIEDVIGLGFDHDLTRAAEYYARGSKMGSAEAGQLLSVACSDLQAMTSTLAKGAVNDFCQ